MANPITWQNLPQYSIANAAKFLQQATNAANSAASVANTAIDRYDERVEQEKDDNALRLTEILNGLSPEDREFAASQIQLGNYAPVGGHAGMLKPGASLNAISNYNKSVENTEKSIADTQKAMFANDGKFQEVLKSLLLAGRTDDAYNLIVNSPYAAAASDFATKFMQQDLENRLKTRETERADLATKLSINSSNNAANQSYQSMQMQQQNTKEGAAFITKEELLNGNTSTLLNLVSTKLKDNKVSKDIGAIAHTVTKLIARNLPDGAHVSSGNLHAIVNRVLDGFDGTGDTYATIQDRLGALAGTGEYQNYLTKDTQYNATSFSSQTRDTEGGKTSSGSSSRAGAPILTGSRNLGKSVGINNVSDKTLDQMVAEINANNENTLIHRDLLNTKRPSSGTGTQVKTDAQTFTQTQASKEKPNTGSTLTPPNMPKPPTEKPEKPIPTDGTKPDTGENAILTGNSDGTDKASINEDTKKKLVEVASAIGIENPTEDQLNVIDSFIQENGEITDENKKTLVEKLSQQGNQEVVNEGGEVENIAANNVSKFIAQTPKDNQEIGIQQNTLGNFDSEETPLGNPANQYNYPEIPRDSIKEVTQYKPEKMSSENAVKTANAGKEDNNARWILDSSRTKDGKLDMVQVQAKSREKAKEMSDEEWESKIPELKNKRVELHENIKGEGKEKQNALDSSYKQEKNKIIKDWYRKEQNRIAANMHTRKIDAELFAHTLTADTGALLEVELPDKILPSSDLYGKITNQQFDNLKKEIIGIDDDKSGATRLANFNNTLYNMNLDTKTTELVKKEFQPLLDVIYQTPAERDVQEQAKAKELERIVNVAEGMQALSKVTKNGVEILDKIDNGVHEGILPPIRGVSYLNGITNPEELRKAVLKDSMYTLFAGHKDEDDRINMLTSSVAENQGNPAIKILLENGFITKEGALTQLGQEYADYLVLARGGEALSNFAEGIRIKADTEAREVTAKALGIPSVLLTPEVSAGVAALLSGNTKENTDSAKKNFGLLSFNRNKEGNAHNKSVETSVRNALKDYNADIIEFMVSVYGKANEAPSDDTVQLMANTLRHILKSGAGPVTISQMNVNKQKIQSTLAKESIGQKAQHTKIGADRFQK